MRQDEFINPNSLAHMIQEEAKNFSGGASPQFGADLGSSVALHVRFIHNNEARLEKRYH
jgi:hypothetical protein